MCYRRQLFSGVARFSRRGGQRGRPKGRPKGSQRGGQMGRPKGAKLSHPLVYQTTMYLYMEKKIQGQMGATAKFTTDSIASLLRLLRCVDSSMFCKTSTSKSCFEMPHTITFDHLAGETHRRRHVRSPCDDTNVTSGYSRRSFQTAVTCHLKGVYTYFHSLTDTELTFFSIYGCLLKVSLGLILLFTCSPYSC